MTKGLPLSCCFQYTTIYFTLNSDSENQDGWYIYLSDDELNDDEIEAWQKIVSIS